MRACVCDRLHAGQCFYCRNPVTIEERRRIVRAGIPRQGEQKVESWTKEQAFEQERQRLAKKRKRKKKT